jgi:serine protease DegQ
LLAVGDKPVSDTVSMLNLVAQLTPGEKVSLTVLRKSNKTQLSVVVGKRPRMKQSPHQDGE